MFKCLAAQTIRLANLQVFRTTPTLLKSPVKAQELCNLARPLCITGAPQLSLSDTSYDHLYQGRRLLQPRTNPLLQPSRQFYAKGSKVRYLDFRYKQSTCHLRSHLLIIRRQKMKKHRRLKWRKKYKCVLAKERLKREIAKEKTFRVELLNMIKQAEQFDPREYALNKINELHNQPKPLSKEERLEELKELIRVHRYQVDYIKPKHKRVETYGLDS